MWLIDFFIGPHLRADTNRSLLTQSTYLKAFQKRRFHSLRNFCYTGALSAIHHLTASPSNLTPSGRVYQELWAKWANVLGGELQVRAYEVV